MKDLSKDLLSYDFNSSSNATEDERNRNNLTIGENKDVELPLFCFASVSAATGNFSEDNKLGQGGFGPVYKVNFDFLSLVIQKLVFSLLLTSNVISYNLHHKVKNAYSNTLL